MHAGLGQGEFHCVEGNDAIVRQVAEQHLLSRMQSALERDDVAVRIYPRFAAGAGDFVVGILVSRRPASAWP